MLDRRDGTVIIPCDFGSTSFMLVDSHCHIDAAEFDVDRSAIIAEAVRHGVGALVVPAVEVASFGAVVELARRHSEVWYMLGIHPMYVDRADDADLIAFERWVSRSVGDPKFLGIGEIGLDHFVPGLDRSRQARFFDYQLRVAKQAGLPVVLHVRRSQDTVLKHLRRMAPLSGIAHAFNGSRHQADEFVKLGFALGFGGAMTFDRALQIRRLAVELPLDAIVLETDAPDIPPAWRARQRNTPIELPRIAATLASLRGIDEATCASTTTRNVIRVLPRLSAVLGRSA